MGGVVSTNPKEISQKKSMNTVRQVNDQSELTAKLTEFLYPIYYTSQPLTEAEKQKAIRSFKLISTNQAEEFYRLKKADPVNVTCNSPMEFLGNRFYRRLLEIHPTCQPLFGKSTMKQGTLLFRMISFVVSELQESDSNKFTKTFEALAMSHNRIGVRAAEYAIFGEVLFWTLKLTVGKEIYDAETHRAWIKIYSRMLSIIIPIVVKHELSHSTSLHTSDTKRMTQFVAGAENEKTMNYSKATGATSAGSSLHSSGERTQVFNPHVASPPDASLTAILPN